MSRYGSRRHILTGYLFVLPWVAGFLLFLAYPMGSSLYMSFQRVFITTTGIRTEPVGWDNYKYAFLTDPVFVERLLGFLKTAALVIPIVLVFSLFVALMIDQSLRLKGLFRALFFLPVIITSGEVVNELIAQGAASVPVIERYGIIEFVKANLSRAWSEPLISVIQQLIVVLWYSGVQILVFLAALQKVNVQTYEAAAIDGASPWEAFWKITLPVVKPFILVNLVYTTVDLFTNPLNPVIAMMRDHMFRMATGFGYAAALAWTYFAIIFGLLVMMTTLLGRSEEYRIERGGR